MPAVVALSALPQSLAGLVITEAFDDYGLSVGSGVPPLVAVFPDAWRPAAEAVAWRTADDRHFKAAEWPSYEALFLAAVREWWARRGKSMSAEAAAAVAEILQADPAHHRLPGRPAVHSEAEWDIAWADWSAEVERNGNKGGVVGIAKRVVAAKTEVWKAAGIVPWQIEDLIRNLRTGAKRRKNLVEAEKRAKARGTPN